MRLSLWLLALTALSTGGCVFPCTNGACVSSGEPRFVSPAARFFGTETPVKQTTLHSDFGCNSGRCQPIPYPTCSKYLPFVDRWTSSSMAKRCADRYLLRQQFQCRRWISKHYKAGFRDAFDDVANGESGEVPAVPPPKYWNTHYRTEKGKRCVELYFDGYRAGSALAASELNTMQTIGASYDWSIEKPKAPCGPSATGNCGHGGACSTGQGCQFSSYASGGLAQQPVYSQGAFPQGLPPEQPSVFAVGPRPNAQSSTPGFGPANSYPTPKNFGAAPIPDPGFGRPQNQVPASPGQFGRSPGAIPQQTPNFSNPVPNLPSPTAKRGNAAQNLNLPSPALPTPGYSTPGGNLNSQASPQSHPATPFNNQPNPGSQPAGPLRPGFSGQPPGTALPGKLGPPDEFKSDPPAWQYRSPQL